MFNNAQGFTVNRSIFNNVGRDQINLNMIQDRAALEILSEFTKDVGAAHDSAARYPLPRCHPETRQEIKADILQWCRSPSSDANVFWVNGPAGVGKSAIAQTIAELVEDEGLLASSFFFSRNDGKRGDATYLVPTIAYQLAYRIPELNDAMTKIIQQHPGILSSSFDVQFSELLVGSCQLAVELYGQEWMSGLTRRVIVIDGLDECETQRSLARQLLGRKEIRPQDLIPPIAPMLNRNLPFQFLLFSRPEPRIREALEAATFGPHMRRHGLDDSWDARRDIRTFLDDGFSGIRTSPRNANIQFPDIWPASGVIDKLIDKACGQFIYAATVLKFVDDEYSQPIKQLSIVLGLSPTVKGNSPFQDLDVLYRQILSSNPDRRKVMRVLCALVRLEHLQCDRLRPNAKCIETLLGLEESEVSAALSSMHSVLDIADSEVEIRILHVSFSDFLRNKSRSGPFFIKAYTDYSFNSFFLAWYGGLRRTLTAPATFCCVLLGILEYIIALYMSSLAVYDIVGLVFMGTASNFKSLPFVVNVLELAFLLFTLLTGSWTTKDRYGRQGFMSAFISIVYAVLELIRRVPSIVTKTGVVIMPGHEQYRILWLHPVVSISHSPKASTRTPHIARIPRNAVLPLQPSGYFFIRVGMVETIIGS
ncbi:nwd2 [Moniliophthora roreri MCA 2997]|uniref:Nwd2 n=1 Tax=Moniliophthora roreri (strain MCA 2997) TaxID=1381753 RepID=V2WIY5_MONRO|nr:nwd2 [Moniliophthora roreri MCA 2997]